MGQVAFAIANTTKGPRDFYGLFLTRADNTEINTIQDLKGKKGWVVGYTSAAGYMLQQAYALNNGVDLKKDCVLTEAPDNKQEKVVMAVFNREADFGCVRNGMIDVVKDRIDVSQIKVLQETEKYSAWVLSAYSAVDKNVVAKISKALLNAPAELLKEADLPGKITGFVAATDSDFESWRKVADKVGQEY